MQTVSLPAAHTLHRLVAPVLAVIILATVLAIAVVRLAGAGSAGTPSIARTPSGSSFELCHVNRAC